MSEDLKPCPMCGRNINLYYHLRESDHPYDDDLLEAWPSCHCPLSLKESAGYGEEEEQKKAKIGLIEYWNILPRYPRPLRWTTDPPKEPGWYWFRNTNQDIHVVCIAYEWDEHMVDLELVAWFALEPPYNWHTPHIVARMDGEWAGPIPEPEK